MRIAPSANSARSLSLDEALVLRVSKHYLHARAPSSRWLRVVSDIGGLQVQSMSAARLAVAARVADFSAELLDAALFRRRSVVKVYGMRGTVHALATKDWPLFFAALRQARRGDTLGNRKLSPSDVSTAMLLAKRVLSTGPTTLKELAAQVPIPLRRRLETSGAYPWIALVKDLQDSVAVCFGPPRGPEVTFVTSDRWIQRRLPRLSSQGAVQQLARRYLRAFAPATAIDFAYWSGLPQAAADRAFTELRDRVELRVEGQPSWMLRGDIRYLEVRRVPESLRLLPDFDTYLLGHRDKTLILDPAHSRRVFPGAGRVAATVVHNGRVVATWRPERDSRGLRVSVAPFRRLTREVRASIGVEAERLATFLGTSLVRVDVSSRL